MFSGTRTQFWVRVPEKCSGTRPPEIPDPALAISDKHTLKSSNNSFDNFHGTSNLIKMFFSLSEACYNDTTYVF